MSTHISRLATNESTNNGVHWKTACSYVQHAACFALSTEPPRNLKRNKMNNAPFAYEITMAGTFPLAFHRSIENAFSLFSQRFPIHRHLSAHTHKTNVIAVMFHMLRKMCMCHINRKTEYQQEIFDVIQECDECEREREDLSKRVRFHVI